MNNITKLLKGDFVFLDLGASSPSIHPFIKKVQECITLIEIDAIEPDTAVAQKGYHKRIILKKAVSDSAGVMPFYRRNFFHCSSFLEVNESVSKMYGMESISVVEEVIDLECTTVDELLKEEKIERVDFFKTDLEGLDTRILKSAEPVLKTALAVQSELRFQPYFIGEPSFIEACSFLDELGFEIIHIQQTNWKPNTTHRKSFRDGRTVMGDFLFFMKEEKVKEIYGDDFAHGILKQILIAKSNDLNSYAEYLFEKWKHIFPAEI